MLTKKKLSKEILVLLAVSVVISIFLFAFLNNTVSSICYRYLEHIGKMNNDYLLDVVHIWVQGICLLASVIFFVVVFLFCLDKSSCICRRSSVGSRLCGPTAWII